MHLTEPWPVECSFVADLESKAGIPDAEGLEQLNEREQQRRCSQQHCDQDGNPRSRGGVPETRDQTETPRRQQGAP